jgi:hypothetical protein
MERMWSQGEFDESEDSAKNSYDGARIQMSSKRYLACFRDDLPVYPLATNCIVSGPGLIGSLAIRKRIRIQIRR